MKISNEPTPYLLLKAGTDSEWSGYDKTIAGCHLANARVVIVDTEYGQPIDNEHDLEEIYRILEKKKTGHTKNERHGRKTR